MSLTVSERIPADLLIRSATVTDPLSKVEKKSLDVTVRNGKVAELSPPGTADNSDGLEEIDAQGLDLFPAFVDPHVHLRTPGQEHKESVETGTKSAAAGGFCAVIAMPNTDPVLDSVSLVESVREQARQSAVVPVGVLAAITTGLEGSELTEMAALRRAGVLGFTDDGLPVQSAGVLSRALSYQRMCGGVISLHEEDPSLSAGGAMHEGELSARLGITGIPSISESTMVTRDIEIARYQDGHVHMQHLSSKESVEAVRAGKASGVKVTAEATPHHLLLTDAAVSELNTSRKMNPPLREESDRQALIAALKDGTIDCIATDHAPHAEFEKDAPFEQAPMGTTGLETSFAAVYTELVRPGTLTLTKLIELMTVGGTIYGLKQPQIEVGAEANLCLINLEHRWTVGESGYVSRSSNSCFDGRKFYGQVELTVAAGSVAFSAQKVGL